MPCHSYPPEFNYASNIWLNAKHGLPIYGVFFIHHSMVPAIKVIQAR
jgi:hypothetical protein